MGHYAKVVNGTVVQVITATADFFDVFVDTSPGAWIKTSYNTRGGVHYAPDSDTPDGGTPIRANYAVIGGTYDAENDVFYSPRPFDMNGIPCASWTISAPNWTWTPPVPYPTDAGFFVWDELKQQWVLVAD